VDNVFLAEIVLLIAKWELMYMVMPKRENIVRSSVLVVAYALRYVLEVSLNLENDVLREELIRMKYY
jgi:hypothetical protein